MNRIPSFRSGSASFWRFSVLVCLILFFLFPAIFRVDAEILAPGTPVEMNPSGVAPLFPFAIPKEAPQNITNVKTWTIRPEQKTSTNEFLRVEGDCFVNDRGVVRFVGSNMTGNSNLPETPEDADFLATSLARFGIGIMRLHFFDNPWSGIMKKDAERSMIDPEKLDRLDRMIYAFKKEGIYVNLNLHVARQLDERDGFVKPKERPKYDKGLDNFEPRMIEFQKQYARDLLTHVNPYTKLSYCEDPCVAMIEINNENSVLASWHWGTLDTLPEPYLSTLRELWNDWLAKKYASTKELESAWGCRTFQRTENLLSENLFTEFSDKNWQFVKGEGLESRHELTDSKTLKFAVMKKGETPWAPQILCPGLAIKKGFPYSLSVRLRAKEPGTISLAVTKHYPDWRHVGLYEKVELTSEWKQFTWEFYAETNDDDVRAQFGSFSEGQEIEIADLSFTEGGRLGFDVSETLEAKTISPIKRYAPKSQVTPKMAADFSDFLIDLENRYWQTMFQFIKNELHAKAAVSGTQLQYGSWRAQARLDYCDIHAYWNHPVWTDRSWDENNWFVRSVSTLNSIGEDKESGLRLAALRVLGRPFTVSEFNHPFPNLFLGEGLPATFALAAFQDWSAIFQYTWSHRNTHYDARQTTGYFDMVGNSLQLAHLPACWAMFVRKDVKAASQDMIFAPMLTEEKEKEIFSTVAPKSYHRRLTGLVDYAMPFAVRAGVRIPGIVQDNLDSARQIADWFELPDALGSPEKKWIRSESGELYVNFEREGKGFMTVNSPRAKLFTGFVDGRDFQVGDLFIRPGKTRLDYCTISMAQTDPTRYLLTATGVMTNTGEKLEDCGQNRLTYRKNLGEAPVLVEGIPADIVWRTSARTARCFALDPTGERKEELPVSIESGVASFHIDPKYQTVWYEITEE